jgi:toxin FitB
MLVLDTNVLSELMRPSPDQRVAEWLRSSPPIPLATTSISVMEVRFGLERLPPGSRRVRLAAAFEQLLRDTPFEPVLPLDEAAARLAGRLRAEQTQRRGSMSMADAAIAAITLSAGATLVTRNIKDFEGLDVPLLNPWDLPDVS